MGCCAKYILICAASAVFSFVCHAVNAADFVRAAPDFFFLYKYIDSSLTKKKKKMAVFHHCSSVSWNAKNSILLCTYMCEKNPVHLNISMYYIRINAHIFACASSKTFS